MFDINIVNRYVDSYFPPNFPPLFFNPWQKSKQTLQHSRLFIQMQICLLTNRKIENW